MSEPKGLHRKLAEVMAEADRIPKNGTAPQGMGGFKFVQVGDAADAIRKALGERGVSMIPTNVEVLGESEHETRSGGTMTTMTVRTTWTLTDGETGQTAVIQSIGTGADSGDKFSPKAQTNAMKYALLMGFLLSTGDDPETSDSSDRGARAGQTSGQPAETLTPKGTITRAGIVAAGSGQRNQLEPTQTPDGHHVGFRLELGDDKAIPQVYVDGPLGTALTVATDGDPRKLLGSPLEVTGDLYEVRSPGRRAVYRLHATRLQAPDFTIPAPESTADPLGAPEAPSGFTEAQSAALFDELERVGA